MNAPAHGCRRGFTLMEMLLVLALLVALAGMSWPLLRGSVESGKLRDAAAQVRNELARTRLAAMESGREQVLCFMPGGDRYCVAAAESIVDAGTCSCEGNGGGTEAAVYEEPTTALGTEPTEPLAVSCQLPDGVSFAVHDAARIGADGAGSEWASDTAGRGEEGERIEFHPDGTCLDATIRLAGADGYEISIEVRGLTAVATVGPLVQSLETP